MKIAQLTDCHLQPQAGEYYKGIDPDKHLQRCLAWVVDNDVDRVLLTGDLCHHGPLGTYQRLLNYLQVLSVPYYWLPGNHDNTAAMKQVGNADIGQDFDNIRVITCGTWDLVLLNSTFAADGQGGGSVSRQQLQQLQSLLEQEPQSTNMQTPHRPKLLVLHHNPIAANSLWQDPIMLGNSEAFVALVTKYPAVKSVVCGHIHQPFDQTIQGLRWLATPATSVQFACHQDTMKVQPELGPSLRTLTLQDDGTLITEVVYLAKTQYVDE